MAIAAATLVIVLVWCPAVEGQSLAPALPPQVLNGLVYPTSSQQFLEAGRQQLEREINRLQERQQTPAESILRINESLLNQKPLEKLETLPTESQQQPD